MLQDSTVVHLDSANETIRPVVDPKKWVFPNPAPRWIKLDEEAQHQQLSQRIKHDSGDHYGDDEADDGQGSDDGDAGSEEAVAGGGDLFIEGEEGSSSNGPGSSRKSGGGGQNSGGTSRGTQKKNAANGLKAKNGGKGSGASSSAAAAAAGAGRQELEAGEEERGWAGSEKLSEEAGSVRGPSEKEERANNSNHTTADQRWPRQFFPFIIFVFFVACSASKQAKKDRSID